MARSCVVYTASAPLRELSEKLSEDGVIHLAASVAAPNELLESVRDHRPDLVLADLGSMPDAVLDLLDKLPTPRPRLIVTGPQDRSGPILRAMRMGVREYIDSPPNEGELRRAVEEVTADLEAAAAADPPAKAIVVMGAKGGCGATTVASQLARALRRTGGRVALIDLNLPLGDVTLHFDIQPAYSVANIARESERLDPTYLRTLLHGPAEGVQILAAPARAEEAELVRGQHVEQVLTLLREDFDWVVLDVSRAWSDTTVRALDLADQILLVTLMDVPTLHHTRQHLDLLERLGHAGERVRLVANRYSKNDSVTDRDLGEFLDRGLDFRIPNAYRTALACVNQGACVSDVAPRSALATAYTQLSEALHEWCGLQVAEEGGSAIGRAVRKHLPELVMALRDRLRSDVPEQPKALEKKPRRPRGDEPGPETAYQELKSRVHNRLFELIDLARLGKASEERVRQDVSLATRRILEEQRVLFTLEERERVVKEIQDEVFGLGPLEPLLADPTVSDILVNGHAMIYVERMGRLERTVARFKDDLHLMRIIEKIVSSVGRRVDELNPMVDARLADGSRVNAIIPPLALDGPLLSIRRFPVDPLGSEDLVELGTITPAIVELFRGVIGSRLNVLVSGGTGAGKTTMLNVLSGFINPNERIITIEDSAELQMHQAHVGRLETRPASIEGKGEVTQRQLVINALRMRPDRIILGEVRGSEAFDMLQAMNTGHDGSLTTIHANSPRDALSRIENMVAMTGLDIPQRAVRSQISSAIHVVAQLARLADGRRRLVSLCEITGLEGDMISMQEIFTLEKRGLDSDGVLQAEIVSTGIRPHFADMLRASGVELSPEMFERPARESW